MLYDVNSEIGGTGFQSIQSSSLRSHASRSNAGESAKDLYIGRGLNKNDKIREKNDNFYCKSISEKSPEKDMKMQ